MTVLDRPVICGIVNATPDSFYDGGRHDAVAHARRLLDEGADWLDVGGESTRAGSRPVSEEEEWSRVEPVLRALAPLDRIVSIDTTKPEVARRALDTGARVLNDVQGLSDPRMAELSARAWGTVVMHTRGTPATMATLCSYEDLVSDVRAHLVERAARARSPQVWIDPGIGFAKDAAQSAALLRALPALVDTGLPVLLGASRKSFLGPLLGRKSADDRLFGSLGAAASAYHAGVRVFRVHDVGPTRDVLDTIHRIATGALG